MSTIPQSQEPALPALNAPTLAEAIKQFKDWFFYLLRRWWIIMLVVLFAAVLGVVFAWLQKPKYESHLTFALEESSGGLSGALSLAAEFGLNLGGSRSIFAGDNILEIITSRRVVEKVLLTVDSGENGNKVRTMAQYLLDLKREGKKPDPKSRMDGVNFPVNKDRKNFNYLEDSVLYALYSDEILTSLIAQRPDKKLGIYEVRFTADEERYSKIFTERLMDETIRFYIELRSAKSKQTLQILEDRVASLRGNVSGAISSRSSIQDANLNPAFAAAQAPLQQRQVDITAYGAAYGELFKNLELARYQFLQDVPLLQIIDDVEYPLLRIKKGRLMTGLIFGTIAGILAVLFFSLKYKMDNNTDKKNI